MAIGIVPVEKIVVYNNDASYYDLDVITKHTFIVELELIDLVGELLDITGATATLSIKESWDVIDSVIIKDLTINELSSQVTVELDASETDLFERAYNSLTNFIYEVNVSSPTGYTVIINGKVNATRGIEYQV